MLEEDRAAVCGPRYAHQAERRAYRAGHAPSQVVLGGRKVAIRRPRARRDGAEVPLPTVRAFADADPLNRRVVDQMLIGVATRQYARSLEPLGADVSTRGTSKSAVSRRFVAQTQAQLDAWRATPLDALELTVLMIDGVQVGRHCIVVALGIDNSGAKHPLGLWEGATENTTVCQGLLSNLQSRGLRTDRSLLVVLDGAKALAAAVTQTWGRAAVVHRCQVHKCRNILEHLPEAQRPWVKAILTRAYTNNEREDREAPTAGPRPAPRFRLPECRRQRAGRAGRDADRAGLGPVGTPPTLARHHERHRESAQSHPSCEAQCETLARGDDGAAVGGRRRARSREGVPPGRCWKKIGSPCAGRGMRISRSGAPIVSARPCARQRRAGWPQGCAAPAACASRRPRGHAAPPSRPLRTRTRSTGAWHEGQTLRRPDLTFRPPRFP